MSVLGPTHANTRARPRSVSSDVAVAAYFGGRSAQGAWGVLFACLVLFWFLSYDLRFSAFNGLWRLGPTVEVTGAVHSLIEFEREDLGIMPGVGQAKRALIEGIYYGYTGPDGISYNGIAMGLRHGDHQNLAHIGTPVRVVCSKANLGKSYVKGLSVENETEYILKGAAFWVAILAFTISLGCILNALRRGNVVMQLLNYGEITKGKIVDVSEIPFFSKFGVWRLRYALSGAENVEASLWCNVTDDELPGEEEPILRGPGSPPKIFPLSLFPGGVQIDEHNRVTDKESSPGNYLLIPGFCAIGYAWFAFWSCGFMSPPWVF